MALFGKSRRRSPLGSQPPIGGADPYEAMEPGLGVSAPQEQSQGLGTRLLGEGWEGKAAAFGSALQGNANAVPQYMADQQYQQQQAAQQAQAQRQASLDAAAENAQWYEREQYKNENRAPTAQARNFENYRGLDAAGRAEFDQFNPVVVQGANGPVAVPRSSIGGVPSRPVGRLTPIGATTQNTPAPQLGENGLPSSLTRAQYQAVVNARGQAATDEWAQRHNIRVTN